MRSLQSEPYRMARYRSFARYSSTLFDVRRMSHCLCEWRGLRCVFCTVCFVVCVVFTALFVVCCWVCVFVCCVCVCACARACVVCL